MADEINLFESAYRQRVPVLLKGPTGSGKTRFVEHMAWRLGSPLTNVKSNKRTQDGGESIPLVTIACHEDLTASDNGEGLYIFKDASGNENIKVFEGTERVKTFLITRKEES